MQIHEKLKFLREQEQKTQAEVSAAINKSLSTYRGYESGKIKPNLRVIIKISNYYQISLEYLCGRLDNQNPIYIPMRFRKTIKKALAFNDSEFKEFASYLNELTDETKKN